MFEITAEWIKNSMGFDIISKDGHICTVDASPQFGGQKKGPLPKELVLMGLAGCTGMDVIAILKKMKQAITNFRIEITSGHTTEDPVIFKDIRIKYFFRGSNLDKDKLQKAVNLSQQKYCGVSAMLKKAVSIEYEVVIE